MKYRLVVTEKTSVMNDIAAVLGADKKGDGFLCGNGYIVAAARGHLVRLKQPQEYDMKYDKWALSDLPIIPKFEFTPIKGVENVLDTLDRLMNSSDVTEIIEATDAGREGECIFRYIYNYVGCTKPFKRLWISSLTAESIKKGFENLRPSSEFDGLYEAGLTRSKLDWLYGINLSRLYTLYSDVTCSVGRVQTAVVNMIAQRDSEVKGFVKKPYYKLKLENGAEWFNAETDSFDDLSAAQRVREKCLNQTCRVVSAETKQKKENRPLLYSLTSLQIEANEKYGLSAIDTLEAMQSLYEKKLLTYPRTDSNYLTDDMAAILPERVKLLRFYDENTVDELLAAGLNIDGRVINNTKVSDHHAIIPTEMILNAGNAELTKEETAIIGMVITRFLAALSPQYEYSETEYVFDINGEKFGCKVKKPVNYGWKKLHLDNKDEYGASLPYNAGDTFTADTISIAECETAPPKHFTESTLLKAMENIDRRIEDKELAEYVTERGLGTPATRAETIEHIMSPKIAYVQKSGKQLIVTNKGISINSVLPDEVKSVEMTAAMELQLSAIQNGTVTADEVIAEACKKIQSIIEAEKGREHISLAPKKESLGKCPKCGGNVYKYSNKEMTVYYCENSSERKNENPCIFRVYEDDYFWESKGKKFTENILKDLLTYGKVKVTGFISAKTGKSYDAVVSFMDRVKNGKTKLGFNMEFENKTGGGK